MSDVELQVKLLYPDAKVPVKAHEEDACYDVFAYLQTDKHQSVWIQPGERRLINTGICLGIPSGWEVQLRPRSGKASKEGLTVLNTPATIDSGYIGEIKVLLINHGNMGVEIKHSDKIAQMKVSKVPTVSLKIVETLDDTQRGSSGFGSSGR